jgi:transcriptional regulator with XRE-family HTH domain
MAKQQDRFVLTPELGQRLRSLRLRAGVSQEQVAARMGRKGKGAHTMVGNLERARVKNPTLGLIADFLRACRARMSDIADIVDRYTNQPVVEEKKGTEAVQEFVDRLSEPLATEALYYDIGVRVRRRFAGQEPVASDERVLRVQKLAAKWLLRQKLEFRLNRALDAIGVGFRTSERVGLANHGRRVWGVLNRTRKHPRDPEKRRAKSVRLLAEARAEFLEKNNLSADLVDYLTKAVIGLHDELEREGELDRLPTAEEAAELAQQKPRDRVTTVEQTCLERWQKKLREFEQARTRVLEQAWEQARPMVAEAGVMQNLQTQYRQALMKCWRVANDFRNLNKPTRDGQREKSVRDLARSQSGYAFDWKLFDRVAAVFFDLFDREQHSLPPDPWFEKK